MKSNAKNNVLTVVNNSETEVKEQAGTVQKTGKKTLIKITPRFNQLTTKGVEMLKNMGDLENAKLWIDDFVMEVGSDHTEMACLLALLQAIRDKCEADDCLDHPVDFISQLQDRLFSWTVEFNQTSEAYVEALKTGDFIVDKLIQSDPPPNQSQSEDVFAEKENVTEFPQNPLAPETEQPEETWTERQKHSLKEISQQIDLALTSDKTPDSVKECLETIIYDMATEVGSVVGDTFDAKEVFPRIILEMPFEYGRGVVHSVHAILRMNTTAFQEFYDKRLDEKDEYATSNGDLNDLAKHISVVMKNPLTPTRLFNAMADELSALPSDWRTPEAILSNLQGLAEEKKSSEQKLAA